MEDIQADMRKSREIGESSWSELFTVPSNFRRLSLGFIIQFSVQMTGVSAIQYYSTTIFTHMGFSSTRILLFQSINSVIALIGEAACVMWIDHTGRRRPFIIGNCISGMSFVVGSALMARYPGTVHNNAAHYVSDDEGQIFNDTYTIYFTLGLHYHNLGLQLLLQRMYRPSFLGYSSRDVLYAHES
jgi:MFS family permease